MANTYEDFIYSCYNSRNYRSSSFNTTGRYALDYNKTMACSRYMCIDLSKDRFEIPCVYKYLVTDVLKKQLSNNKCKLDVLYIPMMTFDYVSDSVKTANPLLKRFFLHGNVGSLLSKMKAGDTWYIGGEGIIMYDDMTPLIMFTLEVERSNDKFIPVKQILRINPIVYGKTDLIAKHIRSTMIGKIIPLKMDWDGSVYFSYTLRRRMLADTSDIFTNKRLNWDFRIIIEDFSDFFVTPTIPDCTANSENINEFLFKDKDNIVKQFNI